MHEKFVVTSPETQGITCAIPYSNYEFITGYNNGMIKLLRADRHRACACCVVKTFIGHTQPITHLLLLRSGELVSADFELKVIDDTTVYFCNIRVWDITSCSCKYILKSKRSVESIVALNNGLIAIAGCNHLTSRAFDVWDIKEGTCLFTEQQPLQTTCKLELALIAGEYLCIHDYDKNGIYVWKVTQHECSFVCSHYEYFNAITSLPTGEIAIRGCSFLHIYNLRNREISKVYSVGKYYEFVDYILPLSYYRLLTVDKFNHGYVYLWDYLTATKTWLAMLGKCGLILVMQDIVLNIKKQRFYFEVFPELPRPNKKYLEIIKNARLLSQAYRTGTGFFAELPQELNISIAALTSPEVPEAIAERIATEHFCKPEARQDSSFPTIF